jgi:multiple sugar transport system permease protein
MKVRGENTFRTLFYLPAVLSGVPTAMLWLWLLNPKNGLVNVMLRAVGIENPPSWLFDADWAKPALVLMRMWALGSGAVIFLAGLQDIPVHLLEAAEIDGANRWQRFWKVTLPMLSPTMFFQIVTSLIAVFQIFGPVYVWSFTAGSTASAGPQDSLLFYALHLYHVAFGRTGQTDLGRASAMGWLLFIFILFLTLIQFRLARRWVYYEAGPEGAA